jgi:hypothetical protein
LILTNIIKQLEKYLAFNIGIYKNIQSYNQIKTREQLLIRISAKKKFAQIIEIFQIFFTIMMFHNKINYSKNSALLTITLLYI